MSGILAVLILSLHRVGASQGADTAIGDVQSSPSSAGGDSLSVRAVFGATGGTITTGGTFTAGPKPGAFRIVATSGRPADTSTVTVSALPAEPSPKVPAAAASRSLGAGIPFGPFGGWAGSTPKPNTESFTLVMTGVTAEGIIDRISAARSRGLRLITAMTGGAHSKYKTGGAFDMIRWRAAMNRYNSPDLKAAVAAAVEEGTLVGNILIDEPANTSPESSWGPVGTMNKARVDSMAVYAKGIFPTLPMGATLDYRIWDEQSFRAIDFQVSQYRHAKGNATAYRDGALALAARDGYAVIFSMNILDGGTREANCPIPETGGRGTYGRNCRMTAEQVSEFGKVLGPAGCAFLMWRYDPDFMASRENQQAFNELAGTLATAPARSCSRR